MKQGTLYLLLAAVMTALLTQVASAQWTRTRGPEGAGYISMAGDTHAIIGSIYAQGLVRYRYGSWEELSAPGFDRLYIAHGISVGNQAGPISYRSTDYGDNWTRVDVPGYIIVMDDRFYAMRQDTLFRSDDALTWSIAGKMPTPYSFPILSNGELYVLRGLMRNALSRSTDGGATWSDVPSNIAEIAGRYRYITAGPGGIYLADETHRIYRSTDRGEHWNDLSTGIPDSTPIQWMKASGDGTAIWAGSDRELFRLVDDRWAPIPMPSSWPYPVAAPDGLLLSTQIGPFKLPSDGGEPISLISGLARTAVTAIAAVDSVVVAGTSERLFRSTNDGTTWEVVADLGLYEIANDRRMLIGVGPGALRSADSGLTWEPLTAKLGGATYLTSVAVGDGEAYLSEGLVTHTSTGRSWTFGGIYRSTDRGQTWARIVDGLPVRDGITVPVYDLAVLGDLVLASTDEGVFRSTDHGSTWVRSQEGLPTESMGDPAPTLHAVDGRVYLKYGSALYLSTDGGLEWSVPPGTFPGSSMLNGRPHALNGKLYVHTLDLTGEGMAVHSYGHDGTRWTVASDAFPRTTLLTDIVHVDDRLFAGSNGHGVWRFDPPVTSRVEREEHVTGDVTMVPNPTAGTTEIRFALAKRSDVRIELIDMLGRPLRTLTDGTLDAGRQRIGVDVGGLAPGIYFVKLATGGSVTTERIVVR